MERWAGRVALVTGAGSGIGASIAENLAKSGMKVIGCARNIAPIEASGKLIAYRCDLSKESEIEEMFAWIDATYGGVDVLVNNAGLPTSTPLLDISGTEIDSILKVNVTAMIICAKLAVKSMQKRNVDDGHIFNINSGLGHVVTGLMNFYTMTKFAVNAFTQGLRKELAEKGSRIRISGISPGRTKTNFHPQMMGEKAEEFYNKMENLEPQNVSDALLYALAAPESVMVYDVQLQPVNLGSLSAYKK